MTKTRDVVTTHLKFEFKEFSDSGLTGRWVVRSTGEASGPGYVGSCLGFIHWHAAWRRYTFSPHTAGGWMVFDKECLRCMADFIEQITKDH